VKRRSAPKPRRGAPSCDQIQQASLLAGKTSFTESGLTASVRREPGETIRFYRTDDVPFREAFGLSRDPACDLLVHLATEESDVLAFVELKGVNAEDGVRQIESTYRASRACLVAEATRLGRKNVSARGLVLARGPGPTPGSKLLPIEHKTLPKKTKTYDFGSHLR
jgi:hypothetical protein